MAVDQEKRHRTAAELKEMFEQELDLADQKISRLRVLYDQYFMGIEKMEPLLQRKEIQRMFNVSQILKLGATVHKFRYRALQQRFTSYSSYWDRIVRLIEEGRIRRGVTTPPLAAGTIPAPATDGEPPQEPEVKLPLAARRRRFVRDTIVGKDGRPVQTRHEQRAGGTGRAAADASPGGKAQQRDFAPHEVEQLFARLVEKKRAVGESIDKLTPQVVQKSIRRTMEQVTGEDVRFRVVCRDGKVSLTAVMKKKVRD